jgi:hypothetical protein
MPIHPDRWHSGRLRPRHVELGGITDEDGFLGSDPGESQRLTKNLGVGLCDAEFFGDEDKVNQAVDSEELEFRALHLCWSVCHDPDRASGPGVVS